MYEAKSISWAKMDEDEFERLYSAVLDVLLAKVYGRNMSNEEMDDLVNQYLSFA